MCSEAWQAPTPHAFRIANRLVEKHTRQTLVWNTAYWLETSRGKPWVNPGTGGVWITGSGVKRIIARGKVPATTTAEVPPPGKLQKEVPWCSKILGGCASPFSGVAPTHVLVTVHGVFLEYGAEIDPNDLETGFRAMAGTSLVSLVDDQAITSHTHFANRTPRRTDTYGWILLSDNPRLGARPWPGTGIGRRGASETSRSQFDRLRRHVRSCNANSCWFGPSHSRDTRPNLMSHELFHVFAAQGEVGAGSQKTIEDSPLVSSDIDDGGSVRRGYNLDFTGRLPGLTPKSVCRGAVNGYNIRGRDFIR